MNLKNGISVCLLAYKEEENLRLLLPQIKDKLAATHEAYEIIVVDTAQPLDNSRQVCDDFGCRYINQEFPGFGGAFKTGIKYAQYSKFLIMDSDGSHNPKYIPDIYNKFIGGSLDVVIGSRYVAGGKTFDAKSSIVMSKILNGVFRIILGVRAKDISTDFRMYHTEQLKQVERDSPLANENYDVLQEILLKLKLQKPDKKLNIGEVPITFEKRVFGESKRRLFAFIMGYAKTMFAFMFLRFPTLRNMALYGTFGVIAAGIDYGVFTIMLNVAASEIASLIGNVTGFAFTYTTNTFLNFKKRDKVVPRLVSYAAIVVFGSTVSTVCIALFKNYMDVYMLKALLLVGVSIMQFCLNKFITYRR
ncbi:hypothetical protein FACS1894217_03010 [Clostridia bacterium]|nr:hypothetical protein FACS1894217_03010 [Clostridia bacterium]